MLIKRNVLRIGVALAFSVATLGGVGGPAQASPLSGTTCGHHACIHVEGAGRHIDWVRGDVGTWDTYFTGFYHFYIGDWSADSSTGTWWKWGASPIAAPPDREWPENTLACVEPWEKESDGHFERIESPVCLTVHS